MLHRHMRFHACGSARGRPPAGRRRESRLLVHGDAAPDNLAHARVAMRRGAAARSRHLLRRYYVLRQRIERGACGVVHIPDAENPADFLTKWVPKAKLNRSLAYVTGSRGIAKRS